MENRVNSMYVYASVIIDSKAILKESWDGQAYTAFPHGLNVGDFVSFKSNEFGCQLYKDFNTYIFILTHKLFDIREEPSTDKDFYCGVQFIFTPYLERNLD